MLIRRQDFFLHTNVNNIVTIKYYYTITLQQYHIQTCNQNNYFYSMEHFLFQLVNLLVVDKNQKIQKEKLDKGV